MVNLTIDNRAVTVPEKTTILNAAKSVGLTIPTLCYLRGINDIGSCRICIVEVDGMDRLVASCNTEVSEGMVVSTNSPRVRNARRTNLQLLLSDHSCHCPTCSRNGNCSLQRLAMEAGIVYSDYESEIHYKEWNKKFPLIRDESKCIKCMRCIQICEKVQSVGIWDLVGTGSRAGVGISGNRTIENSECTLCGQCITHCPVGALRARDDTDRAFKALADKNKITVAQIAPAVRSAWGEALGLTRDEATVERLVSALRTMGVDYIFDTDFTADLTIMEEANEFLGRFTNKDKYNFPMFTSCCPGWVRFIKSQYPDMVNQLSTAKSPQQMFGTLMKTWFPQSIGVEPERICSISIMPCTSKKSECDLPVMNDAGFGQDVDFVLTTREIDRMIKSEHIDVRNLPEGKFDMPLGLGSGAGVIFGASGGVMEAALRTAYFLLTGKNPDPDAFSEVRGMDGWRECSLDINGIKINIAVASGLGNARKLVEAIRKGKVKYDFVEIMSCPGGCSGGGGQPINPEEEQASVRADKLYGLDAESKIRFSHENPSIQKLYETFFDAPLSSKAHKLLHTDHYAWEMPAKFK